MTNIQRLARFGVLTDVQYADHEDAPAWYDHSKTRHYRNALNQVHIAFNKWSSEPNSPEYVLQLGDIIDGLNRKSSHAASLDALRLTLELFESNPHIPTFHAVGNHELYNFKRCELAQLFQESLLKRMKINAESVGFKPLNLKPERPNPDDMTLYYKFKPNPRVKMIALDCFEISVIGYDPNHCNYQRAAEILYHHHGHDDYDGWDTDHLLSDSYKRFQSSNGAVSESQLNWLDNELSESDENNEKVVVFGHVGLHPKSCNWDAILWNYDEVISCFNRHKSVVAYFCGHTHNQGYAIENGIHYVVFHGIIETSPQDQAFATVTIYENEMEIQGFGLEKTRVLDITPNNSALPVERFETEMEMSVYDESSQDSQISGPMPVGVEV